MLTVVGVIGFYGWLKFWPAHIRRLAQQHADAGYSAWRAGKTHEAEIAFASSQALDPEESRPAILLARMYLANGRTEEARKIFEEWLRRTEDERREQLVAIYRDSLVCAGQWSMLAEFSSVELARRGRADARLLTGLVEGARLARWNSTDLDRAIRGRTLDDVTSALLRAQVAINEGDRLAARGQLTKIARPLPPVVSLVLGRLWQRAGDRTAARLAVARVDGELDATELLLANLALSAGDDAEWENARQDLRALAQAIRRSPTLAGPVLDQVIAMPDAAIAEELSQALAPQAHELSPEIVSGMWFYCSLSGAQGEVPVWREQLGTRFGFWPINLVGKRLDERVFVFAANAVPLSRYMLDSLLSVLPAAADKPVAPEVLGAGSHLD